MPNTSYKKIALVGNPNTGKSSLFNQLTGLNQKVGNYSGVTVDKKEGKVKIESNEFDVLDLPGVYSIHPKTLDEKVVLEVLSDSASEETPKVVVSVIDASNLRRSLLLFSQVVDLGFPVLVALTMNDVAHDAGIYIDEKKLSQALGCSVVKINSRTGQGIEELKKRIYAADFKKVESGIQLSEIELNFLTKLEGLNTTLKGYNLLLSAHHYNELSFLSYHEKKQLEALIHTENFKSIPAQARENIKRYEHIAQVYDKVVIDISKTKNQLFADKLDKVLTHPILGYVTLLMFILIVIQLVFTVSEIPMGLIENFGGFLMDVAKNYFGEQGIVKLLVDGLLAGVFGVLVFIPQIALLFFFLGILEESGYMARAVFITDKLMRKVGMNGRSVIPLFSGVACAVPAIMATRTIDNPKDRLITILVTPLISCSARIPVYTVLIGLFVPDGYVWGIIGYKALVFMGLYFFGFFVAIICSYLLKKIVNIKHSSFFVMELPSLKMPNWYNVWINIIEKVKAFVFDAGKTIIFISVLLTFLSYYGPSKAMKAAEDSMSQEIYKDLSEAERSNLVAAKKMEASYAGNFGKWIEPVIKPLGYDWKIGISLLTSFAAREVFVPTISTIYNLGSDEENDGVIIQKLKNEINPETGKPLYGTALCISLLVFYSLSMQCVSTLATTKRETKSWTWTIIQFVGLTTIAYLGSLISYQLLS
ncbi:MAG: ferrous iron transport protein B [Cytophagales bacterium]